MRVEGPDIVEVELIRVNNTGCDFFYEDSIHLVGKSNVWVTISEEPHVPHYLFFGWEREMTGWYFSKTVCDQRNGKFCRL